MPNVYVVKQVIFNADQGSYERKLRVYSTVKSANDFAQAELQKLFEEYEGCELERRVRKKDPKCIKYDNSGCLKVKGDLDDYSELTLMVTEEKVYGPDEESSGRTGGGSKKKQKNKRKRETQTPDWEFEEEWKSEGRADNDIDSGGEDTWSDAEDGEGEDDEESYPSPKQPSAKRRRTRL